MEIQKAFEIISLEIKKLSKIDNEIVDILEDIKKRVDKLEGIKR